VAKLTSLVVDIAANTASLSSGLDQANKQLTGFAKKADEAGKLIAAAFTFDLAKDALTGLARFIKSGAEAADRFGDLSASVGASTEELSKLSYAAGLSGSSTQEMIQSLMKLSKQMGDAAGGGKEQIALFKAMGVSVTDVNGKLRSSTDVFKDVAELFAKMQDGAAKTTLAQELFGKSGAKLIPLLNEGKEGLRKFADEAQRFGLVVTKDGAESAAQFNDALDRMKGVGEGLAMRVAQDLAPSLAMLSESFLDAATSGGTLSTWATVISSFVRVLASAASTAASTFELLGTAIGGAMSILANAAKGDFKAAKEAASALGKELDKVTQAAGTRILAIWNTKGPGDKLKEEAGKAKTAGDDIIKELERVKAAMADSGKTKLEIGDIEIISRTAEGFGTGDIARPEVAFRGFKPIVDELAASLRPAVYAVADFTESMLAATADMAFDKVVGSAGKVGGAINAGMQGAALGGPVGAAVGVGLELLTSSEQFGTAITMLDDVFQTLSDLLGSLLEPMLPLIVILGDIIEGIANGLGPMFELLSPWFQFLFEVLKGVGVVILGVAIAIGNVWNFVTGAIADFLDFIGMDREAEGLRGMRSDVEGMNAAMNDLMRTTYQMAEAEVDAARATNEATEATEEILNAPSGYKGLALARYNAADMGGLPGVPVGGDAIDPDPTPTPIEIHLNADLKKYIRVEARQERINTRANTMPLEIIGEY
jgi:hypothetical protein